MWLKECIGLRRPVSVKVFCDWVALRDASGGLPVAHIHTMLSRAEAFTDV
jgi:hypothetical protein